MARPVKQFVCQSCGAVYAKWAGQCDACQEWNSIVEEVSTIGTPGGLKGNAGKGREIPLTNLEARTGALPRHVSGIGEFDRALGGGLVPGSATLVGGDPGIGKSTILLQAVSKLAASGVRCVYVSGEEAVAQVQMRAERLGLNRSPVQLGSETNLRDILTT